MHFSQFYTVKSITILAIFLMGERNILLLQYTVYQMLQPLGIVQEILKLPASLRSWSTMILYVQHLQTSM